LSALARQAVLLSANLSGIQFGELMKSPEGAPLPVGGYFWSLAHKSDYVTGVVADFPIGVDIERIRPCAPGLYRMAADETEWKLGGGAGDLLFFRYWTAKEAVLKSAGIGLRALSKCRVTRIVDDHHLRLSYKHQEFNVAHFYFNGHIAAILDHPAIRWMVQDVP
jgi:4'-phosphopantetheinyl transferase